MIKTLFYVAASVVLVSGCAGGAVPASHGFFPSPTPAPQMPTGAWDYLDDNGVKSTWRFSSAGAVTISGERVLESTNSYVVPYKLYIYAYRSGVVFTYMADISGDKAVGKYFTDDTMKLTPFRLTKVF